MSQAQRMLQRHLVKTLPPLIFKRVTRSYFVRVTEIDYSTVEGWEQGRCKPEDAALLWLIYKRPWLLEALDAINRGADPEALDALIRGELEKEKKSP